MKPIMLLVTGNTPRITSNLTDPETGLPIDLSAGGTAVALKVRLKGATDLKGPPVAYSKLPGWLKAGAVRVTPPYDVAGKGGRCVAECPDTLFDTPGDYEGEIEVTFADGTVLTDPELERFSVREELEP